MRHLLIAFLLLVFSIQGTFVAMGEDPIAAVKAEQRHALALSDAADAFHAPDAPAGRQDGHDAGGLDGLDGSSMIDELSDYLPGAILFPDPVHPVATRAVSAFFFLSADLPASRPPPRA